MIQLIAIVCFIIWFRKNLKKAVSKDVTDTTNARYATEEGSREDYLRTYVSGSERESYGNWQDTNGGGNS